jgi:hypothetical protein
MKKVIRLTESDLVRIVKRVIRESEDDYDSEMSRKDNRFQYNKSGLERTIKRIDRVEKIIKLLGDEDSAGRNLKYYRPLGITSVDELIDYKGGYTEEEY